MGLVTIIRGTMVKQQVSGPVCPCVNARERHSLVGTFMAFPRTG